MKSNRVTEILDDIEDMMRQSGFWSVQVLAEHLFASRLPSCCETLSFQQWLQFILSSRLRTFCNTEQPLPRQCDIKPMAEEVLGSDSTLLLLIQRIADLDAVLTQK